VQMAVSRDQHLYVTESSGVLRQISLASPSRVREIISGLKEPEGLAETPWGSLIVAEVGSHSLLEIDPLRGTKSTIARGLPIGLHVGSALPQYAIPTGVAVDQDGTIFLSADMNNAIYRFRPCK